MSKALKAEQNEKVRDIIKKLWDSGRWSTQTELAEAIGTEQGTISRILDRSRGTSIEVLVTAARLACEDCTEILGITEQDLRVALRKRFNNRRLAELFLLLEAYSEPAVRAASRQAHSDIGNAAISIFDWRTEILRRMRRDSSGMRSAEKRT